MKQCWICGANATTGEHKIKRSDLARVYGTGSAFKSARLNYLKSDQTIVPLQGPNSRNVKYLSVLCSVCNNARSQPFDRAYDQFVSFIEQDADSLLRRRQLNFASLYGEAWREKQAVLFKYFVKAFGCRISDAGQTVPNDLRNIFTDKYPKLPFAICFAVDENEVAKPSSSQTRLGIGNIVTSTGQEAAVRFAASSRYRWLLVSYWYNWGPFGAVGEPWHRDQQFICLGSYKADESKVQIHRDDGSCIDWPGFEA